MKKLKLQVEELQVVSFETERDAEERGTVAGQELISGTRPTCKTCLTNITCCTPML